MKRFHYGLTPALDAARSEEVVAARAFVVARDAAREAEARVADVVVAAAAIRYAAAAAAAATVVAGVPARALSSQTLLDRERCLVALAAGHARACQSAQKAAWYRDAARGAYDAGVRRRRAFETHRERALAAYERECERIEACEFDEANTSIHEAARTSVGKDDA